jgi:hypothetical protein
MEEKRPTFVTTEDKNKLPLLIIDKKGSMGVQFAANLAEQFLIVLVSGNQLDFSQNTIHVPYLKKIPTIPDNLYSHMLVFYNGEEEVLDMLPALMKKANSINARLIFITSLPYSSHKLLNLLSNHDYHSMQMVIYGEVFQTKGANDNMVNVFLNQAHAFGRIILPHELGRLYPVFLDDVFAAIIQEAFSSPSKQKPLLVFPRHAISELSIARMLKKKNPLLKIDFKKYKAKQESYHIPSVGEYYLHDYPLEERLQSLGKSYKPPTTDIKHEKKTTFNHRKTKFHLGFVFLAILAGFLLPIVISFFMGVVGVAALYLSVNQIEKGNIKDALPYAQFANTSLKLATTIGDQFDTSYALSATEVDILKAASLLQDIADNKSKNPKEDFLYSLAIFKNSLITLQKMKAEGELPKNVATRLSNLETILTPAESTLDSMPHLLGFEGKKTYLVLFQNNMELRPGGGFIGSYGLLTFDNGRITSFKVHDVYDADGKLTAHIEPPFALKRYLGSSHWFLRDSNFSIDFPTNAKQAISFLKLETGETVSGVIAVDTSFLKNILGAIGPVEVSDYKETVTKDNFYLLTQTHAEKDFFPGSTQKKDFLRALLSSLQAKIEVDKNRNFLAILQALGESITTKHLFFAFSDVPSQKLFTVNNLSSSLWDGRERKENTFLDFFGVIDANLGLNKTNYYITRSIDQVVRIDSQGSSEGTATITYVNNSKKESPFGGSYKNYLRFVLPANTTLKEVKIDNLKKETREAITDPLIFTAKNFVSPKELEIERGQEQGKDTFGFLVTVPMGATRKISITYASNKVINANAPEFGYDLSLFKQPGTEDDAYSFTLVYPSSFRVVSIDPKLSDLGGKLVYSGKLNADLSITAKFGKK